MVLNNLKIVMLDKVIDKGFIRIEDEKIVEIGDTPFNRIEKDVFDKSNLIAMPGFIDIHVHGSSGIDFMDASEKDYEIIANNLFKEGVTTFLATTLTSDKDSLAKVCDNVKKAKNNCPSLGGIHFEGPYISLKYKGAQNPDYIRNPNIEEFDELQKIANGNIRYITLAPEKEGAMKFIKHVTNNGVVVSSGHTDATFDDMKDAIDNGLSNVTHTHNAMSPYHHRNPGVVTASMYFDNLYCEVICDRVHVSDNTLKTFYKIVGPNRFIIITDALKVKHTNIKEFQLFGLDCIRKDDAAYLVSGPLAGSILTMDQGVRNVEMLTGASLIDLAKISSKNAAEALRFHDRGEIKINNLADLVLLDNNLNVVETYKLGKRVN